MKISVLTGYKLEKPEVDIRCLEENEDVRKMIHALRSCEKNIYARLDEKEICLKPAEILYFEVTDRHTFAYTREQSAEIREKLSELTSKMFYGYVRISKSMVVNVIHIGEIVRLFNGNLDVKMDNGEHVIISRRYVSEFNKFIKDGGI